eukprot:2621596-Rhodomonas_salina.3
MLAATNSASAELRVVQDWRFAFQLTGPPNRTARVWVGGVVAVDPAEKAIHVAVVGGAAVGDPLIHRACTEVRKHAAGSFQMDDAGARDELRELGESVDAFGQQP